MKTVVAIGDLHCGHRAGLTPPAYWYPTAFPQFRALQREMWKMYESLIAEIGKPHLLIVNGDAIEGKGPHSESTELLTADRETQAEMAVECIRKWNAENIVMTYGTPSHTGKGEDWERWIAKELGCDIHGHCWPEVDGLIFDVKHKVGSSSIPHGRHTATARERVSNLMWSIENEGQPRADVFLRSHVHYHQDCGGPGWRGMTLPALQSAGTKFGARQCSMPVHWGVVSFQIGKEKSYSWKAHTVTLQNVKQQTIKF